MLEIHFGDNLELLRAFPDRSFDLIYIDPPFNTGRRQQRTSLRTTRVKEPAKGKAKATPDPASERTRVGFGGHRYKVEEIGRRAYADAFDDYLAFLEPRLVAAHRLLRPTGSFFLHLDYREVHYAKVLCDAIFGRDHFINEIIWSYDYGGRSKSRWSPKHDNILWYAADPKAYTYRYEDIDRIPYMAPRLVTPEKAARGKTPTDCWWNTIVSPMSKEKTGYPTQKPLAIIERIIRVHSKPGDSVLDFFAGSGTFGEAAARHGRHATLIDLNPEAIEVMLARLGPHQPRVFNWPPTPSPAELAPASPIPGTAPDPTRGESVEPASTSPAAPPATTPATTPATVEGDPASPSAERGRDDAKTRE